MAFVGEYQHRRKAVSPTSTDTDLKARKPHPMKKTYEYRAYPTIQTAKKPLPCGLRCYERFITKRFAWRKDVYETTGESVKWTTQGNALPKLKQESPSFAGLHSDILQDCLRRLNKAYQAFFRRVKAR